MTPRDNTHEPHARERPVEAASSPSVARPACSLGDGWTSAAVERAVASALQALIAPTATPRP